jgi:hypothetical protein
VELVHAKKITTDLNINKFRPILIGSIFLTCFTLIPIGIWFSVAQTTVLDTLTSAIVCIIVILLCILSGVYGYKLNKLAQAKKFKKRLITFLSFCYVVLAGNVLLGMIIPFVGAKYPWRYIGIVFGMRTLEFLALLALLILFYRTPRGTKLASSDQQNSSELTPTTSGSNLRRIHQTTSASGSSEYGDSVDITLTTTSDKETSYLHDENT